MDLVGWGMRVTVIAREYATQEIAARVFGNCRTSGGCASGGVAWLEDPGTSGVTIGTVLAGKAALVVLRA